MKSWLIKTSAPFCGTDQYYGAYAKDEDSLLDWLYDNWFDQECENLWNSYSFHCEDEWQDEWEGLSEDEKEEVYDNDYDNFIDNKYEEWCSDCGLSVSECHEDEFDDYAPDGTHLEIVYDDRQH
jgi:hypothetical protein